MAKEYIVINSQKQSEGLIALSKHVIESIVKHSIEEEHDCFISEESPFRSSVNCKIVKNRLAISVDIKLKYGINVNEVCESIQDKIKSVIYLMTEIDCENIKMNVVGFIF